MSIYIFIFVQQCYDMEIAEKLFMKRDKIDMKVSFFLLQVNVATMLTW